MFYAMFTVWSRVPFTVRGPVTALIPEDEFCTEKNRKHGLRFQRKPSVIQNEITESRVQ